MKKHPLKAFLLITFGITWGLGGLALLFLERLEAIFGAASLQHPLFFLAVYAPALSALLVIRSVHGLAGVGAYLRRLRHWRVGLRWYLLVLVGMPLLKLLQTLINYTLGRSNFLPSGPWYTIALTLITNLVLIPGAVEELGWRGFALSRLQRRFSALISSFILGSLWGIWHLPAFFVPGLPQSELFFPLYCLNVALFAVPMTALYNGTGGCIPLAILFHWQLTTLFERADDPVLTLLLIGLALVIVTGNHLGEPHKYTEVMPRTRLN